MTCIIGLKKDQHIYIGGDSCGSDQFSYRDCYLDRKVWKIGDQFIFGGSGSYRAIQILKTYLPYDKSFLSKSKNWKKSPSTFMIRHFIPTIKKLFEQHDFSQKKDEKSEQSANLCIGFKNGLFLFGDEYDILEIKSFCTIGSGYQLSQGAMSVLIEDKNLTPQQMIKKALTVTARHMGSVTPPFHIVNMKNVK